MLAWREDGWGRGGGQGGGTGRAGRGAEWGVRDEVGNYREVPREWRAGIGMGCLA